MKNTRPVLIVCSFLLLCSILAGCCYKKSCSVRRNDLIMIDLGGLIRSTVIEEYNRSTGQLQSLQPASYYSISYGDSIISFSRQFNSSDSLFLNQRFFILVLPSRRDTINNISYQQHTNMVKCSSCPGASEAVNEISNFSYSFRGQTYHDGDTIIVNP